MPFETLIQRSWSVEHMTRIVRLWSRNKRPIIEKERSQRDQVNAHARQGSAIVGVCHCGAGSCGSASHFWAWSDDNSTHEVSDFLVVGDRVYALTDERLFALDAASGHMLWSAAFPSPIGCHRVDVLSGVLVCTGSQNLVAFDVSHNGSVVAHIAYPGCKIPRTQGIGGAALNV